MKKIKYFLQKQSTQYCYLVHTILAARSSIECKIKCLIIYHDNDSPHTAVVTETFMQEINVKMIEHPSYSTELAMCDFWLFFTSKKSSSIYIYGKFVYKNFLMQEETTLNMNQVWHIYSHYFVCNSNISPWPSYLNNKLIIFRAS